MIPRKIITADHVNQAAKMIVENQISNNSTKFDALISIGDTIHALAPKRLISKAFEVVTGEPWSVRNFSGGQESNKFLTSLGFNVTLKNG